MSATDPGVLLVADHPGPREKVTRRWAGRGPVATLTLPFWQDSTLSRAMRLHALSDGEQAEVLVRTNGLLDALRAAVGVSDDQWQYLRQVLESHAVTPLVEAVAIVEAAARRLSPRTIATLADVRSRDWWSGQTVAEAAGAEVAMRLGLRHVAERTPPAAGALLRAMGSAGESLRSSMIRRHAQEVLARAATAGASGRRPTQADVLILAAGPVVEGLALRMAEKLADARVTYELARDPLAPPSAVANRFVVLGGQASPVTDDGRRAATVLDALKGVLSPPLLAAMRPRLVSLEARELPLARWLEADAEALLDRVKPRVVVDFHFLPRLATPYLVAATRRGIRTVCCQHGLIASLDYPSPWYDEYLLFNEYTAEVVRPRVGEGARLTVVGNPTLDALAGWQPKGQPEPGERPAVLLATQPNDPPGSDAREDWWFAVLARACAAVGAEAWVKLHPQQSPDREGEMYRRAMEKAGCEGRIIPHGTADLRGLIAACDVFVSQFSTTILEALALGKPVVFVELREGPPFYPFDDFGAAIRVTRPDEAEPALRRAMSDEGRSQMQAARAEFSARHLEPWDGHALERMAQAILAH